MASNSFGTYFRITTFGESHGPGVGVVIDGCPSCMPLSSEEIDLELKLRAPGQTPYITPRKEPDHVEILSGVFEGQTTGAPIALWIANRDVDSSSYQKLACLYRPGHAHFTYLHKYGIFDHRGGGRSSARETAARVAAGAIAKKLLQRENIVLRAYLESIGDIQVDAPIESPFLERGILFCPDPKVEKRMIEELTAMMELGDSIGGVVRLIAHLPVGLGDPIYDKLEAKLAYAMLSIPASKGFEVGAGFKAAKMKGSEHNDSFYRYDDGRVGTATNHAGGILGGISTGEPLDCRIAFKPTSSIKKEQTTTNLVGEQTTYQLPANARHDPCVAVRAVPVVEAMAACTLIDLFLGFSMCKK